MSRGLQGPDPDQDEVFAPADQGILYHEPGPVLILRLSGTASRT